MNFFSRRRKQGQIKDLVAKYRTEIDTLEKDYERFNTHLHIVSENPIIPFIKLIGGIVSVIISIVWVIQLLASTIYVEGSPIFSLLDGAFADLN